VGDGRNLHRDSASNDLKGGGEGDGDHGLGGERGRQGIASEEALVRGGHGHGIGLADGEAAGIIEAHDGIGKLGQVVARFSHGAVGGRGADPHPVENGGLVCGILEVLDHAAGGGHVISIGSGQPDVTAPDDGGNAAIAILIAYNMGLPR